MSIEITGPQKFAFQDSVCVLLALEHLEKATSLIVEPANGEDAELTLRNPEGAVTAEIQVKGGRAQASLSSIADILCHFPPRQTDNCLLERILKDPNRLALCIVSGRCTDNASPFVISPELRMIAPHRRGQVRRRDAIYLLSTLTALKSARREAPLNRAQRQHCVRIARNLTPKDMLRVAKRILVLERITPAVVRQGCKEILQKLGVPSDRLDDVLNRLQHDVEQAKSKRADLLPLVRKTVTASSVATIRPEGYVPRGSEAAWIKTASEKRTLFLSGPPRCGKSYAARYVAAHFQDLGFELRQGNSPEEAIRFLSEPSNAQRVYWLDDPLGGTRLDGDAAKSLGLIRSLAATMSPGRRLIMSQNRDHVLSVTGARDIKHAPIGSNKWFELGSPRPQFLINAWEGMVRDSPVPSRVHRNVAGWLRRGKVQLEVGNLQHLASMADLLPAKASLTEIIRRAQEDAGDLGRELTKSNPSMSQLLITLAIASQPDLPLSLTELAFITSLSNEPLLGKVEEPTIYGGPAEEPRFPSYPRAYSLTNEIRAALDELESRRFAQHSPAGLQFTHPFYRAAAESVLVPATSDKARRATDVLERALFSLGPKASRAAARALMWVYDLLVNYPAEQERVLKLAISGLESIFPATRDLCLSFLLRNRERSGFGSGHQLLQWVESAATIAIDDLEWREGEAWIPSGSLPLLYGVEKRSVILNVSLVRRELDMLESADSSPLSPAQAAVAAKYLSQNPESMTHRQILRLLTFDEAAIRSTAIEAWLSLSRQNDRAVLSRIFADEHPRVTLGIYEGLIHSWSALPLAKRGSLLKAVLRWAKSPLVAAILLPRLSVFDRVEYTGANPPWTLFAELMPVIMTVTPRKLVFDDARFFTAIQSSLRAVSPHDVFQICNAWEAWLERELKHRLPSDYELGICDILISGTRKEPTARKQLVKKLLGFNSTGLLITILRDLVNEWGHLRPDEKELILKLLAASRRDAPWLHAILLTRDVVPAEIQQLILGKPDRLSDSAEVLVSELPPLLLACMISVYSGTPQPLWWLGTQSHGCEKLDQIVRVLECMPEHPLFETVLWRALIPASDEHIRDIVINAGNTHAVRLFDYLLRYKIRCVGNWLPKTWEALLRNINPEEREACYDLMAKNAPAILDDLTNVREWLTNKQDLIAIIGRLPDDLESETLMLRAKDPSKSGISIKDAVQRLEELGRAQKPRLHRTYDRIQNFFKTHQIENAFLQQVLESARLAALAQGRTIQEQMRLKEPPLHHWIGPK